MFHFAIVSNSASRLFSTGRLLHLAPLPSCRSLRFFTCQLCVPLLCVFQVCRASWYVPPLGCAVLATRKRALNLRRDLSPATDAVSFIITKIFLKCKWIFYMPRRTGIRVILLLSYTFIGKFFLCFCLKFFGKFFLKDWEFKGHK